ncbi:MAG: SPOR domain-containing protein [Methylomonas lenta]|nr:SPOR domain-containing protein [Methylomonas lenta]
MDQELKQRLIGAAVITALATIFIPMLFDDPIDESGKNISELKMPALPSKAQDVEIMPLPEKVEDVGTLASEQQPAAPAANTFDEGDDEAAMEAPQAKNLQITAKETAITPPAAKWVEAEEDVPAAEPIPVKPEPVIAPKPIPQPATKVQNAAKTTKPVVSEPASKPELAAKNAETRLYLNVGTFSQQANAVGLHDSLKEKGFAVSIKEINGEKGKAYKVRVGPMMSKATAQSMKSKLSQINVNSFVTGDE